MAVSGASRSEDLAHLALFGWQQNDTPPGATAGIAQARYRAPVFSHSPMYLAPRSRSAGQSLGKQLVHHVVGFDAECVARTAAGWPKPRPYHSAYFMIKT